MELNLSMGSSAQTFTQAQYDECIAAGKANELQNLGCFLKTIVDASGLSGENIFDPLKEVDFFQVVIFCI